MELRKSGVGNLNVLNMHPYHQFVSVYVIYGTWAPPLSNFPFPVAYLGYGNLERAMYDSVLYLVLDP